MKAEGWFLDPFGAHEERWFSDGEPTNLVRDGDVEGQDAAPKAATFGELVRKESQPSGPADLRRADEAEAAGSDYDEGRALDAVLDAWVERTPPT